MTTDCNYISRTDRRALTRPQPPSLQLPSNLSATRESSQLGPPVSSRFTQQTKMKKARAGSSSSGGRM